MYSRLCEGEIAKNLARIQYYLHAIRSLERFDIVAACIKRPVGVSHAAGLQQALWLGTCFLQEIRVLRRDPLLRPFSCKRFPRTGARAACHIRLWLGRSSSTP